MPVTHVLDIRSTRKGEPPVLVAPRLIEAIQTRLDRHEQAIIFLNRRGYSSSLQCPQCGYVEMCPNCSVALTFHRRAEKLRCIFATFSVSCPTPVPNAGSRPTNIRAAARRRLSTPWSRRFPGANRADGFRQYEGQGRLRADARRFCGRKNRRSRRYANDRQGAPFSARDLRRRDQCRPRAANPDFRASERVFQLLMQVSGRSGRGQVRGEVFVQTRVPFHPAIQFARHHDYAGFVEQELAFRRSLHYPPYERFLLVTARGRNEEKTLFVVENLAKEMERVPSARNGNHGAFARAHCAHRGTVPVSDFPAHRRITAVTARLRPLFMDRAWPDDIRVTLDVDPVDLL